MKKYICLVFAVIILLSATACNQKGEFKSDVTCEEILNSILAATECPQEDKIYVKSKGNLDTFGLSLWADGLFQECEELSLLSDYAIFTSAGTTTYEVAVLRANGIEAVPKLNDLIERRKETLSLGDKGMYDPQFNIRMSNSKQETVGEFVIFIVTDDNDAALKAIDQFKE